MTFVAKLLLDTDIWFFLPPATKILIFSKDNGSMGLLKLLLTDSLNDVLLILHLQNCNLVYVILTIEHLVVSQDTRY